MCFFLCVDYESHIFTSNVFGCLTLLWFRFYIINDKLLLVIIYSVSPKDLLLEEINHESNLTFIQRIRAEDIK